MFLSRREYPPQITPKMYLLEWCRKEKHPQPVYETVSQSKNLFKPLPVVKLPF